MNITLAIEGGPVFRIEGQPTEEIMKVLGEWFPYIDTTAKMAFYLKTGDRTVVAGLKEVASV